jgi:hypothetical protein
MSQWVAERISRSRILVRHGSTRSNSATILIPAISPAFDLFRSTFTPTASRYQGQQVGGVYIVVVDRRAVDSPEMGIEIASALHKLYPGDFDMKSIIAIIANKSTVNAVVAGEDPRSIAESWREGLQQFRRVRVNKQTTSIQSSILVSHKIFIFRVLSS